LVHDLVPLCTLVTPNRGEARGLTGIDDADGAARALLAAGADGVLMTGADEATGDAVFHDLHRQGQAPRRFRVPHLAGSFHGSGCTLASACATLLADGARLAEATETALSFTIHSLQNAEHPGRGQFLPTRVPR
jgi:hydroxymethylpyrimidine/phosphomethylpyrimidine kinase